MARIGVGNKYNVAINSVGYLIRGLNYKKKDARIFAPRFGTGEMGETDLDTWKAWSQSDFAGGMFQELVSDPTKVDSLDLLLRNPRDGLLHPTVPSIEGTEGGSIDGTDAWAILAGVLYKSQNFYNSGAKGAVYKQELSVGSCLINGAINASVTTIVVDTLGGTTFEQRGILLCGSEKIFYTGWNGSTTFTGCVRGYDGTTAASHADNAGVTATETYKWTAVKIDFADPIRSMTVFNNKLWVTTSGTSIWSFDGASTWASSAQNLYKIITFNGKIYGPENGNNAGSLYSWDGTTKTWIGYIGDASTPVNSMLVFNHRLYIGKGDGLFVYDGVQLSCVLDYSKDLNANNFRYMAVFNGSLYFIIKNVLYRFTGSSVEIVQDLTNLQAITALSAGYGRLWFLTTAPTSYMASGGKGGEIPANGYALYFFDGQGITLYDDVQYGLFNPYCISFNGSILTYYVSGASAVADSRCFTIDLSKEFQAKNVNVATLYPSIFDAGFPNINKAFESFSVDSENFTAGDTIAVYYKLYDGATWDAAWSTLGTITTAAGNKLNRYDTNSLLGVFKKIKFKVVLTRLNTSTLAIRGFSMKYIISPEYKREWQLSVLAVGTTDNPNQLLDGSLETPSSAALRENIYFARDVDATIPFEDVDYSILNGAHNNSVATITVDDTNLFAPAGFIKIDDEIIKYTGKTSTTFTGCTRAALGTSAASHSDNAIVNMYYRVILSDILNEEVYWPVDPLDTTTPTLVNPETILTVVLKEA